LNLATNNRTIPKLALFSEKKQHSLNVLVIMLLSGEIIYLSPIDMGSCDQTIWNNEELRKRSETKNMGYLVMAGSLSIGKFILLKSQVETKGMTKENQRETKSKPFCY
jgi:hypothetical protein